MVPALRICGDGRLSGGVRKDQQFLANRRVRFDVGQLGERADAKGTAFFL